MTIACMMRVKNEERWLAEVLASIQPLTKDILLFDDHSTDSTREIAKRFGCVVLESPFTGTDEARDKNHLLSVVRTMGPDFVLTIDGDEVLEEGAAEKIKAKLDPRYPLYAFPFRYLWNDRDHYRADGVYAKFQQWRMFALAGQTKPLYFPTTHGVNFHCGNTPQGLQGQGAMIQSPILHLGYMHSEDRIRKYHWYNMVDPKNHSEDCYRHMVIGDLYPADSQFLHGGPLKLFTMPGAKP
jgi:glycosyltransferase involved in cell wall biosynthesis